jgi:hypothetical protein
VRVGDYRVIYTIEDDVLLVVVVTLSHRRDVDDRWPTHVGSSEGIVARRS